MRKLFFYVFSIFLCMQSCSQSDDLINGKFDLEEEKMQQEISFPDHIEAYGKAVAKELRVTVLRKIGLMQILLLLKPEQQGYH